MASPKSRVGRNRFFSFSFPRRLTVLVSVGFIFHVDFLLCKLNCPTHCPSDRCRVKASTRNHI
jgi:hypothetical protein